ncbi:MAG: class I tRNA ligase family protein [Patescibacteria group bacterium]
MDSEKAKWEITKFVGGERRVRYRLRDWLISRQRYWGPPIPMIFCETCHAKGKGEREDMAGWYTVPEEDLPVKLPYIENFQPTGTEKSPLATVEPFYKVKCPSCGGEARRETDVSDTFLDSAWYYLRYPSTRSARSGQAPWDPEITERWLPVDAYIGGPEHAVLHLLYVRFLTMVFHDWGLLHFEEPFTRFFAHAHITKDGAKMSKSKGNIVTVDDYVRPYGVDAGRMYLMFLGPFDKGGDFRDAGIRGITRFLERVWRFVNEGRGQRVKGKGGDDVDRIVHRAIRKVTGDIEELQYNTAISALMVLLNAFEEQPEAVSADQVLVFLRLLAPFAPHMAEELWREALGEKGSIHRSPWPQTDLRYLKAERQTLVIQVNGKVRDRVEVEAGAGEAGVREMVLAREKVRQWIRGKPVKKFIYIPGRIMNVVV